MALPSGPRARRRLSLAVIFGSSGVAAVAGSYLVAGDGPAFLVTALAATMLYLVPDALLAAGIQTLAEYGRPLLEASAAALAVGLFGGIAAGAVALADRLNRSRPDALFAAGLGQALAAFALTVRPTVALAAGLAGGLTVALAGSAVTDGEGVPGRRRLLRSLGVGAAAVGTGWLLAPSTESLPDDRLDDEAVSAMLELADDRGFDLPGAEPMVSENFYQVDYNTSTPEVDAEEWRLRIAGGEREVTIGYDELTDREAQHRFVTLRCVSDALNAQQMDTALWTGVPMADLLEEAGVPEDCCVRLEAADGYYQGFPREALERGFLAWRMNGRLLPRGHGYPVRALIPGHWGEINVKWLTDVEVVDEEVTGYWEERGWQGTGPVETIAKIHSVSRSGTTVTVGGHAYAGVRGVDAVEVSVDGGETWSEAELTERLPAAVPMGGEVDPDAAATDAWRMWRYEYDASQRHEVVARAIEPDGTVQPDEETDSFPSGATGWVSREVDPASL